VTADPYSLNNLRDIVIPDPPPLWPFATGLWIAIGVVALIIGLIIWRLMIIRRRNAYRRAGLQLLHIATSTRDVAVIMKRVALAAFPRERVASLYGDDWIAFLQETCPSVSLAAAVAGENSASPSSEFITLARTWIQRHRVSDQVAASGAE
jgi:hypothetical protein